jgi:hypothetical protein
MDMVRGASGNFYIIDQRSGGNESGLNVVDSDGNPLWNSWDASQLIRTGTDLLANALKVAVSPDDKYIAVARGSGFVWIMPLVAGIPDLAHCLTLVPFSTTSSLRGLEFDAVNNLYVDNNSSEVLAVFSPGGTTTVTTSNDATGANGSVTIVAPETTVSINAAISSIAENAGSNVVFTITRTGDTGSPLTVPITVSGTATSGSDFVLSTNAVTIPAFQSSATVTVTPSTDGIAELTETVVLTLEGGSGYSIGSPGSATVSILDSQTPEISFDASATKKLLEGYAGSKASFQLTRRGLLSTPLTVNLAHSGTATVGSDFNAPDPVSFAANIASVTVTLTPINDQSYEGEETATLSVASGTGYTTVADNSVSATIVDDETPAGSVLFSDDFETDSSSQWVVNVADPDDAFVDFAWDYGANAGIPPAPGSSTTLGMRFRCGNTFLEMDGISASPLNGNFTGDYRLKFNLWINYNGPLPDGGPGSTQNFDAGIGTTGDHVNWLNAFDADGIWFDTTGDGADGNSGGDYNAFNGGTVYNDDSGVYAAGVGAPNSGIRNGSNPFYSFWGGISAPAAQLSLFSGQTGVANTGNAGMAWHSVVITKVSNTVSWMMDGIVIATVTNDPSSLSTNVFVGYQDIFATGSLSDKPEMSFGLVDNLRVETFSAAPPTTPAITGIQIVGGNVVISFTGAATDSADSFSVVSATDVNGSYSPASATMSGSGGSFQATLPKGGSSTQFYRIKR